MPRIRCFYQDCIHLEDGFCSAPVVEIDPDVGCRTYTQSGQAFLDEDDWDEEELDDWENDFDDDDWLDDDEDDY